MTRRRTRSRGRGAYLGSASERQKGGGHSGQIRAVSAQCYYDMSLARLGMGEGEVVNTSAGCGAYGGGCAIGFVQVRPISVLVLRFWISEGLTQAESKC